MLCIFLVLRIVTSFDPVFSAVCRSHSGQNGRTSGGRLIVSSFEIDWGKNQNLDYIQRPKNCGKFNFLGVRQGKI